MVLMPWQLPRYADACETTTAMLFGIYDGLTFSIRVSGYAKSYYCPNENPTINKRGWSIRD
jgi:hypothetical protein